MLRFVVLVEGKVGGLERAAAEVPPGGAAARPALQVRRRKTSQCSQGLLIPRAHLFSARRRAQQALRRCKALGAGAAAAAAAAIAAPCGDHMAPGRSGGRSPAGRHVAHAHGRVTGQPQSTGGACKIGPRNRAAPRSPRLVQHVCGVVWVPAARDQPFLLCLHEATLAPRPPPLPFHCRALAVFQTALAVLTHHPAALPRPPLLASRWPPPKFEFAAAARPQQPLAHALASVCTFPRLPAMTAQGGGAAAAPADARLRSLYSVMQSIEVRRCGPKTCMLTARSRVACTLPLRTCPLSKANGSPAVCGPLVRCRWPALHSLHTRAAVHAHLKIICSALANCCRTSWAAARGWRGSTAPSSAAAWTR